MGLIPGFHATNKEEKRRTEKITTAKAMKDQVHSRHNPAAKCKIHFSN
jgi:hypothetical protein